ncbi:MAG: Rad52/Rad22 family DNA repair protein [Pyrinomonadaceae bacterium]
MKVEEQIKNKSAQQREKRARAISAMGLVVREGDKFLVSTPALRGQSVSYEVRRDETNRVVCNCPEFSEFGRAVGYRCEHIMAVKFALQARNTERETIIKDAEVAAVKGDEKHLPQVNDLTESRGGSERGEQETETHETDAASDGPEAAIEVTATRSRNTQGAKAMKNIDLKEVGGADLAGLDELTEREEHSNVLDFSETLKELRRHVDPKLVKQREGWRDRNGHVQMVDYVEWHTVADILDDSAPNWSHTVKDIRQIGELITVTAAITIDGVTREGVGTGSANSEPGIKKAEHDALKRAAVKFGIARDLYKKESDVIERNGGVQARDENEPNFPSDPVAKNLADLVTAKQLGMIRAIAREMRINADEECQSVMNCRTDELSKKAASEFIKHLQELQRPAETDRTPLRRAS